jgi:hypothetical protein
MLPRMTTSPQWVTWPRTAGWPSARMVTSSMWATLPRSNVAMTSATTKRVLMLTRTHSAMEGSFANGVEGAKDGTLAIDGDLAKGKQLRQGGQGYHEENFARDGCLPSPRQSTLLKLANIAKDGNCATNAPVPRAVSSLKTESHTKGCNFTKEVKLVGNGDFADESNFVESSNAAKEVCNSTNKNNSGLSKRQRYKGSDATATTATRNRNKVCRQH